MEEQLNAIGARLVKGFGNTWQSMRAVEIVLDEMTAYFEGTDPSKLHRKRLVEVRQGLEELAESLALYDFEVEWHEPDVEIWPWYVAPSRRCVTFGVIPVAGFRNQHQKKEGPILRPLLPALLTVS